MDKNKLPKLAKEIRLETLKLLYEAGGGHLASSMSIIELLTALYFGDLLKYKAGNPQWPKRDYFLLSNGHACPSYYVTLAKAGFFPPKRLQKGLFVLNSGLEGHPVKGSLPGIEISSGSLGMGLSVGVGIALALKKENKKNRVIVMMSDAEQQEGAVWEAVMAAAYYQLDNLTAIIDNNGIQIGGWIKENLEIEPLAEKYLSFGWNIRLIDGHDFDSITNGMTAAFDSRSRPAVLIAKTVPAKGVYRWEGQPDTHHKQLTKEIYLKSKNNLA